MTQAQLQRDAAFQAMLASISFDLFPRRQNRRRLDYDLPNRCPSAGPELEHPANLPNASVVVPQQLLSQPPLAAVPNLAATNSTPGLLFPASPLGVPDPNSGVGHIIGGVVNRKYVGGQYIPPAGGYRRRVQTYRVPPGTTTKLHWHDDRGDPPAGISDINWSLVYNSADSKVYALNGKDKALSRAARESGETRAFTILMLQIVGGSEGLPLDFADEGALCDGPLGFADGIALDSFGSTLE